ncbi:MAG TPA: GNAT family N-acetyltransferase [Thermoanaerobaculia bacterium]|nr:GNAT family N-acetyltransferase [Thermoanaerobaculia bacterium]
MTGSMIIREVHPRDAAEWLRMRRLLWPAEGHDTEIAEYLRSGGTALLAVVLVAERSPATLAGFIELGLRPYAEGCTSSPVPFIEGWFVDEDVRRQHVGEALVRAAEAWARAQGFPEIASDVELENDLSIAAHGALGFSEVTRLVCFRRDL